jgi:thymidine kinase
MSGSIEVICGPMFCGKTEELIRRLRRESIARRNILAFKHAADDRYDGTSSYASHAGIRWPCFPVKDTFDLRSRLLGGTEVVGIDEIQFFDEAVLGLIDTLANQGVRVICAGLDQDYRGRPFAFMGTLLAMADRVDKMTAVCVKCAAPATKTFRKTQSDELIVVGAADAYDARCRACHYDGYGDRNV